MLNLHLSLSTQLRMDMLNILVHGIEPLTGNKRARHSRLCDDDDYDPFMESDADDD